jgi:hypothetical protein
MITQIFNDSGQPPPPPMPPQALPYYRRALAMAARAIGYVLRGGQDEHENHKLPTLLIFTLHHLLLKIKYLKVI